MRSQSRRLGLCPVTAAPERGRDYEETVTQPGGHVATQAGRLQAQGHPLAGHPREPDGQRRILPRRVQGRRPGQHPDLQLPASRAVSGHSVCGTLSWQPQDAHARDALLVKVSSFQRELLRRAKKQESRAKRGEEMGHTIDRNCP